MPIPVVVTMVIMNTTAIIIRLTTHHTRLIRLHLKTSRIAIVIAFQIAAKSNTAKRVAAQGNHPQNLMFTLTSVIYKTVKKVIVGRIVMKTLIDMRVETTVKATEAEAGTRK